MSYHHDHNHTTEMRQQFRSGNTKQRYGAVVGTVASGGDQDVHSLNGDHLRFYLTIGNNASYQVDVNTQSRDNSETQIYIAEQPLAPAGGNADEPFGPPAYGVFFNNTALSYASIGLTDADFTPMSYTRIENQLVSDLAEADFVSAYGMTFDDGGPNGKGIHDIHYTGQTDRDGALALYTIDPQTGAPKRVWYFFKFGNQNIGR